jgi:predicted DsbA family dithiol-disulfide isomerase
MHKPLFYAFVMMVTTSTSTCGAATTASRLAALIDGQPILQKDVDERASPQVLELSEKIFEVKEKTLNDLIDERLLNKEASRLSVTVQKLMEREVNTQFSEPTPAEVESYYLGIKDRIGRPLEEVRDMISEYITSTRRQEAYQNYLRRLRAAANIVILLAPPRATVSIDPLRVRGPKDAPITIVEFSDFECPYCAEAEDTLRQLFMKYPTQIRLAYRDFPLELHVHAVASAEASRCAAAQGRYWPYHDMLFANQQRLESRDLSEFASQLQLNSNYFAKCTAQRSFARGVQRDVAEGQKLAITGTPAFFVNGIVLSGAVGLDEFSRVIDAELARLRPGI